jgi:sarcosine/dimethylglycine N-methyltransferase
MGDQAMSVKDHYEAFVDEDFLAERIDEAMDALPGPASGADLAGFDQFHVGGLESTVVFGQLLGIGRGDQVLDAGSGLGGPSRYMAETFGCEVTGVDLAPSYVAIARLLADRTALSAAVTYQVGDLAALAFDTARFDLAYSQHVVMNIRDRGRVYAEMRRVVKPGGRFAFFDVLAADKKPEPYFPLPWAEHAGASVLLTAKETLAALDQAGWKLSVWQDVTADARAWFAQQRPVTSQGVHLASVMGPRFAEMASNLGRSLVEEKLRLVMAVFERR